MPRTGCRGFLSITLSLVQYAHELRTDDGTGCIVLGGFQGLGIRDAKADHTGITQVHGVDLTEISLLLVIETFLGTGDRGRRHHVDKTIGMVVDESDSFLAGLRGDEHDDTQVVLVGNGLDLVQIVIEGQVGDDGAADTGLDTTLTEGLDAIMQDGIQITHQHQRNLHLILDGF